VFDNSFIGAMGPPDTTVLMGSGLYSIYADAPPHIAFDGASDDADKENNEVRAERRICVRNNSGNPTFGNLLAALGLGGSADIADYDCSLPALPTVTVDAP
jgi:hypothetical protein